MRRSSGTSSRPILHRLATTTAGLLTLVATGCDGPPLGLSLAPEPGVEVSAIRIEPADAAIATGDHLRFSAALVDEDGRVLSPGPGLPTVTWSVADPGVARVSGSGGVEGAGPGFTEIRAFAAGLEARAVLVVQPVKGGVRVEGREQEVEGVVGTAVDEGVSVRVVDASGEAVPGVTVRFDAEPGSGSASPSMAITGPDGSARTTWTFGTAAGPQELVATVPLRDSAPLPPGLVMSTGNGALNPAGKVRGWAKPGNASEVSVSPSDAAASVGDSVRFEAEVHDEHGNVISDAEVSWASDEPDVATVDDEGVAAGRGDGEATILAEVNGVTGSAAFTVASGGEEDPEGEDPAEEEEEPAKEEEDPEDEPTDSESDRPGTVTDLRTTGSTTTSIGLAFTEVDDGTGEPAYYRVRYALSEANPSWPDDYTTVREGECASPAEGVQVGATFTCDVPGLEPGTRYDFGVIAYRYDESGSRIFARRSSNVAGETKPLEQGAPTAGGLWIDPARLASLPTSGSAWDNVKKMADSSCPSFDLADQSNKNNTCVMAKALVYARTGDARYLTGILDALQALATMGTYDGRALAMGRNLAAYVIAADLIGLGKLDPNLDDLFRAQLRTLRTTYTSGAASSLVDCHERRPNNWGAHCGASRAAVAVYLGDSQDLARTARVFKGFLGDRSSYTGFTFGGPSGSRDHSWECDSDRPVGINPRGCTKDGRNIDGVIPDDQRRSGSFTWPPPQENYVWESLQGILAQALILHRAGYDTFRWEDRAILRAVRWLHEEAKFPAEGDDTWQPHVVNHYYGTSFPAPTPSRHGKNVGWTDWTHR